MNTHFEGTVILGNGDNILKRRNRALSRVSKRLPYCPKGTIQIVLTVVTMSVSDLLILVLSQCACCLLVSPAKTDTFTRNPPGTGPGCGKFGVQHLSTPNHNLLWRGYRA
jgi:hypothetical protein